MSELLKLKGNRDKPPYWHFFGAGSVTGVVEVAAEGRELSEDRFLEHSHDGLIVCIGKEWSMRPVGFGGGDTMYPMKAITHIPNLRGIITLGTDYPTTNFENDTHLDIVIRSLADPHETDEPIIAAVGTGLYKEDKQRFLAKKLLPLQGIEVELKLQPNKLSIDTAH